MRLFLQIIGRILAVVYPQRLNAMLTKTKNILYSSWLKPHFKKCGKNPYISKTIYLSGSKYITIGDNFICGQRLRLDAFDSFGGLKFSPTIEIGNNVSIEKDCHIGAVGRITIGNGVLMASRVYISDHSHGEVKTEELDTPPLEREIIYKGEIKIEDNVWLGEGVMVLGGVSIGRGTIVGAGSVVTKSLPAGVVAAGVPVRVIRIL